MLYADMITEIQLWAKAPHLDAGITSALRAVTLKYHRKEKFWKDLVVVPVTFPTTDFVQVLDIPTYLPNFRQLLQIDSPLVANDVTADTRLTIVQPGDIMDEDGFQRSNIAILAGTSLNLKFSVAAASATITYYRDPVVSPSTSYSSWIADTQPDLLIAAAAARVLAWNNESEIYQAAKAEEDAQWLELLQNNIEGVGR